MEESCYEAYKIETTATWNPTGEDPTNILIDFEQRQNGEWKIMKKYYQGLPPRGENKAVFSVQGNGVYEGTSYRIRPDADYRYTVFSQTGNVNWEIETVISAV